MSEINKIRHPNLRQRPINISPKKPSWIRVRAPVSRSYGETRRLMRGLDLKTVCEEASCPNISECWSQKHATVMILGDVCTRACAFCDVRTGKPRPINPLEPENVGIMAKTIGLRHVVITSVDRDDLDDGGAKQFAACIESVHQNSPGTTVEILTPDFKGKTEALDIILNAKPDVFNHNLETVPRLYPSIRPGAVYDVSLDLLKKAKDRSSEIFTKSGIMVGLGEEKNEVLQVMDDMVSAGVDFLTVGQYLQPTLRHAAIKRYILPSEFCELEEIALAKGFIKVSASPLTRSSYHADQDFQKLRSARLSFSKDKHTNTPN